MYPARYFSLFPPFPRRNKVFVIMSFAPEFQARWENVLKPAIDETQFDGEYLQAERADVFVTSDSILTDILASIGEDRMVIADITSIHTLNNKVCRNDNVMYELGIAHAARAPEEVLVLRSDGDNISFDISQVRVHKYDPDKDPDNARRQVTGLLENALREISVVRNSAVQHALASLDIPTLNLIPSEPGVFKGPSLKTRKDVEMAPVLWGGLRILLQLGIIEFRIHDGSLPEPSGEPMELRSGYHITPFGEAVRHALAVQSWNTAVELNTLMHGVHSEMHKAQIDGTN